MLEEELRTVTAWCQHQHYQQQDEMQWMPQKEEKPCAKRAKHQHSSLFDKEKGASQQQDYALALGKGAASDNWAISIRHTAQGGIQLDTNVTNMKDLLCLLYSQLGDSVQHLPPMFPPDEGNTMAVMARATPFERAIRRLHSGALDHPNASWVAELPRLASPMALTSAYNNKAIDHALLASTRTRLIDLYFECPNMHSALLIPALFQPFLHSHPDHMLTWAVIAFTALGPCQHTIFFQHLPWNRQEFGYYCMLQARMQIRDGAFDGDDQLTHITLEAVTWLATAHFLVQAGLFAQQNSMAAKISHASWRLAVHLKESAMPTLKKYQCNKSEMLHLFFNDPNHPHHHDPFENGLLITHCIPVDPRPHTYFDLYLVETWRRFYYHIRQLELTMPIYNPGHVTSRIGDAGQHMIDVGLPQVMPCEWTRETWREAALSVHYVVKFTNTVASAFGGDVVMLSFKLYAGLVNDVPVSQLALLERRYIDYWHALPVQFRVSDSPYEYLQMDRIQQFPHAHILRNHISIYVSWLATMVRFVKPPSTVDLTAVSFDRMDHNRAALVVAISCDAVVKIYQVLYYRRPCTVEFEWLTLCLEGALLLFHARDPAIRARARQTAMTARDLFRQQTLRSFGMDPSESTPSPPPARAHHHHLSAQSTTHHSQQQQQHPMPSTSTSTDETPEDTESSCSQSTTSSLDTLAGGYSIPIKDTMPPPSSNSYFGGLTLPDLDPSVMPHLLPNYRHLYQSMKEHMDTGQPPNL
ncbi:hypothetical protein BC940DRAFT_323160 [Gongronella butleri]|nr:hypothetical protein BC940DRAFT_323160 [Gongronella butleri]